MEYRTKDMNNKENIAPDERTFVDVLNSISFYKCDNVRIGDLLYYPHTLRIKDTRLNTIKKAVKRILRFAFFSNAEFEIHGTPETLFLMNNLLRRREDFQSSFRNVVELSENNLYMYFSDKFRLNLAGLFSVTELIMWNRQLKIVFRSVSDRMYYIGYIYEAYLEYILFEKYCRKHYLEIDKLVSICDVHLTDCYFTQKFNMQNKKTITLQHGTMCSVFNAWAFIGSHSDYFIANSRFTLSEGRIAGYKHNMIVVGLFSYVNKQKREKQFCHKIEIIGVLVDGDGFRADNLRTISTMASYCEMFNKKLLVKLHPLCDIDIYQKEFNDARIVKFVEKKKTLNQFLEMIDIAVVRNSTTLIEAIQYGVPTDILNDKYQIADAYRNVNILKFSDEKEFHDLIDKRSLRDIYDDYTTAREYFGCATDVTQQYKSVFASLGIS